MKGIPVLTAKGKGIAEAWENSLVLLNKKGCDIKTMYDKPDDPPSKDATMMITIMNPLAEPMIHKDFPGGLEDLQEYVMEVVEGIKNHLVRDPNDPNDTRWEYTYNERLFKYRVPGTSEIYDQIEIIAKKLAETPYSRRAQAITWKVWEDNVCYDPACLQSIWCRLTQERNVFYLNTNVRFRSNDAYKAAFMNMFALVQLQKKIADRISELSGKKVKLGRYVHIVDSYHIYGSYFNEFKERFINGLSRRSFEERTYRYEDVKDIMDEARPVILEKVKNMG
ncbi:MAG: thymidylate synthase [Lentisphaerae bacterium]|nr:thymidylate synthase [Lentisphaerota bacterium]